MAAIAFIIVGMTARGMGDLDVCALEGVLAAAWTIADNRAGRSDGNARRTHGTTGCGSIGIHAVQIVEVSVVPIGAGPIIIVERHRRFGIPDDIADIERIAGIRFPPESVLTDALQDVLSVIDRERRQLRAVVKGVLANDRRGAGDLSRGQADAVFKPVRKISDMQCVHIIKPDLRDLVTISRPRLVGLAGERLTVAGAGDRQPVVLIQFPLDLTAGNCAGGDCFGRSSRFFGCAVIDRMRVRFCRECGHG